MLPFTQKKLMDWAGPRVFRDAQTLFQRGLVQEVRFEPPFVRGALSWGHRSITSAFRTMPDGTVESHCPCRDNTERGIICAHVIAMGLALLQRERDPEREQKQLEEARRAARLAQADESAFLTRVPAHTPGAIPAHLRLRLGADWLAGYRAGRIPLLCEVECQQRRRPLSQLDRGLPLAFGAKDEDLLFVLEDIAGGAIPDRLELTPADLVNLFALHIGRALAVEGAAAPLQFNGAKLQSRLRLDLDRETGELLLILHTELPFTRAGEFPAYVLAGRSGWVLGGGHAWPLEQLLPLPLRGIYEQPIVIARPAVPRFLQAELPALRQLMTVETDLSADLFSIEPHEPTFRLLLRGSPASLSAVLQAEYGPHTLVVGKADPQGHFAIPDPHDLLRYTVRNPLREAGALGRLAALGLKGSVGDDLTAVVGCREVLNFLGRNVPALRRLGWKVALEGRVAPFMDQVDSATPVVQITEGPTGGGWFEVGFHFEDGHGASLSEAEIQRALLKGDAYIERAGRTILLDAGAIEAMTDVFRDCASAEGSGAGRFRLSGIYAAYVQTSLDALDGVDVEVSPSWRQRAERQNRRVVSEPVVLPPTLVGILRPYQKDGVQWLRFLEDNGFCGILADEMGLGKTLQTLTWLSLPRTAEAQRTRPALIVCPTSLVENWAEETRRFVPQLKVLSVSGADRREKWAEITRAHLVVTSYALMRRDIEQYVQHEFSVVVLDEAQHIKNRSTQNAIAAKRLHAAHRLVLTGTPIENSVADLWSIMDFLMPEYLGVHAHFKHHYEQPIGAGGVEAEQAQQRLRRKLQPFMMRRLKRDVARDLPPKIERLASCSLSPDQQLVYQQLLESSRRRLSDLVAQQGFNQSRMEILKTLLRLRQVCCHLDLLKLELASPAPSAKMDMFFELLDEALDGQHRVLVFSQFVSMLTILKTELVRRGLSFCYLDGSTQERQSIVHQFNTDRTIPLFLISLKAGGSGLNLTGADMVVHFDPWWNPAVEDQATDRAHRIGQQRTVYSVKLITKGTIEEKVLALQKRKQAVINATLVSDEQVMEKLNWEDIQELLTL